jgi:hypothetical protein
MQERVILGRFAIAGTFVAGLLGSVLSAQSAQPRQTDTPQPPPAVSPQAPKGPMPALGRPTQATDEVPLFNFDEYFVGKWTFEWDVPESPLGAGGKITGTTVYKPIEGAFYAADTEASGPTGSFKVREVYAYHKQNKTITRQVADSRNLSYLQLGAVGGDLGGLYNIYYESQPFTFKGKTFRMRERLSLTSPVAYRVTTTLSVDGGPFVNYGTRWVSKQVPGVSTK